MRKPAAFVVALVCLASLPSVAQPAWVSGPPQTLRAQGLFVGLLTAGATVGCMADATSPRIGEIFLCRFVLTRLDPDSATAMSVNAQVNLPAGTTFALASSGAPPIQCLQGPVGGTKTALVGDGCPQVALDAHASTWTLPPGQELEVDFPLVSGVPWSAGAAVNLEVDLTAGFLLSAKVQPSVNVPLFASAPLVAYPTPAATLITDRTARLRALVTSNASGGNAFLDLGVSGGELALGLAEAPLVPGTTPTMLSIDTISLAQGTSYRWRFRAVMADGQTVVGADQSFTTLTGEFNLSIELSPGGDAQANPVRASYLPGTQVSVTAVPAPGYLFRSWILDGQPGGSSNPLQLTLQSSHVLAPRFEALTPDAGMGPGGAGGSAHASQGCSEGLAPMGWLGLLWLPWVSRRASKAR